MQPAYDGAHSGDQWPASYPPSRELSLSSSPHKAALHPRFFERTSLFGDYLNITITTDEDVPSRSNGALLNGDGIFGNAELGVPDMNCYVRTYEPYSSSFTKTC